MPYGRPPAGFPRATITHFKTGQLALIPARGRSRGAHRCSASLQLPIIGPKNIWGLWSVLLFAAAAGLWSEKETTWGKALSAPLVSTLIGLAASNVGLVPSAAAQYNVVYRVLLPFAVPLLLLGADLRRVLRDTGRLLQAFALGAAATVVGTVVAFYLLPLRGLGADSWKIAAALMARHIGGAVNYTAVSEALEASPSVICAGLAADNLVCAVYFASLFALAANIPPDRAPPVAAAGAGPGAPPAEALLEEEGRAPIRVLEASMSMALSGAICFAGVSAARALGVKGGAIPCITALVVALATCFPRHLAPLAPSGEGLATIFMQVFFATVGVNGDVSLVVRTAPALFAFSFVQIATHLGLTLGLGRLLGFSRRELLLASNANVGGPSTGAGMATAKGWRSLLVPTILVGILGYATATFVSIPFGRTFLQRRALSLLAQPASSL